MSVRHTPKAGATLTGTEYEAADHHIVSLTAGEIPTHSHAGEDITSGTVADGRVAATLARDSEVTTAVSNHEGAADPHTGYLKESDFTGVDFLVGTATGITAAEIVVGTAPGGELGGTWASPTVDASHSGSTHAATQAAAEATAASALAAHEGAADPHTGYRLESADHSHATTGLQGGTVAHSVLTGIGADDHHARQHSVTAAADHTFPGGTTTFLRADGSFATPTATAADPSYTPGSFTVATETGRVQPKTLKLPSTDRATIEGTARLLVLG